MVVNIEIVQMANSNLQPADLLRASYFDAHSNVALLGGEVSTTSLTSSARFHRGTAHGWREREHNKPREEKFLELVYVISEALSAVFKPRGRIHEIFKKILPFL